MSYYDVLHQVAATLNSLKLNVGNEDFLPLLKQADECSSLYRKLSKLLDEANLDSLCEVADILKVEVLGEQLCGGDVSLEGLRINIHAILTDVYDQLVFRARTYIRDEVANYHSFVEDLDYPAKLEKYVESVPEDGNLNVLETWYPPLEKTISCLSKLHCHIEPAAFTGLVKEAIEVCTKSIQKASRLIAVKSSPMDGQLFSIKHLIILKKKIATFDSKASAANKEPAFANSPKHLMLRQLLKVEKILLKYKRSRSSSRTSSPQVVESQIDVDTELKEVINSISEEFMISVINQVVDPLLSFLIKVIKVRAVKDALSSGSQDQKPDSDSGKTLKKMAFATPEKVAELVRKVDASIKQELPVVLAKIKLYLQNPPTRTFLLEPIKMNIVEAHFRLHSLLKSDYSTEDIWHIGLVSIPELKSQLDSLF